MVENSLASNLPHLDFQEKYQIINKLLSLIQRIDKQIKQIVILLMSFHISTLVLQV